MGTAKRVLLFEEDFDTAEGIRKALDAERFDVQIASQGASTLQTVQELQPDLVMLDGFRPGHEECRICRVLKSCQIQTELKVIILSDRGETKDILKGFSEGADDYIAKPIRLREVVARVKTVLRRRNRPSATSRRQLIFHGPMQIDPLRHEVTLEGEIVPLTISEYKLLHLLASTPGRVYSRAQLSDELNGLASPTRENAAGSRHIDVHIRALRSKLGDAQHFIQTMRGVGYYFSIPSGRDAALTG